MDERKLLERITMNPDIFSGKAIIRSRQLAVERVLGMLAADDKTDVCFARSVGYGKKAHPPYIRFGLFCLNA